MNARRAALEFALGACAGTTAGEPHIAALESLLAAHADQPATHQPAGQWVHCTPALLQAGVSCAHTPRRACDQCGHDHFIAHAVTEFVPGADLVERATLAAAAWATSDTPVGEALAYRDGFIAGARSPATVAQPVAAWLHRDDPRDCISDAKKRDMIEHAGAGGRRLAENYSIALGRLDALPAMAAAVAWDFRVIGGDAPGGWSRCATKAHADELRKPDYAGLIEVRDLFDAPQPPAQADYEEVLADHRRLVRELDVLLNGEEGAALQASLCDIVAQVRREKSKPKPRAEVTDDKQDKAKGLIKTLSDIIHDQTVAMQSAIIEWQHGNGAEAGLSWIANTLDGPGHFPDFDAPHGKHAQFWFNANQANPLPACFCGNPSSSLWMGQGFCCDEHYREAKAKHDAARSGATHD
ncbi:hypothetical protein WK60_13795 [Burkholderia ubonensis]|nr:hypothetical protein WK60_13795 [Burkholderia ubonensis]